MLQIEVKIGPVRVFSSRGQKPGGHYRIRSLVPTVWLNEQVLSLQSAVADGIAYLFFIEISSRRVYQAVARFEGVAYSIVPFRFRGFETRRNRWPASSPRCSVLLLS